MSCICLTRKPNSAVIISWGFMESATQFHFTDWKTPKRVNRDQYSLKLHQTLEVKTTSNLQNSRIILEFKDGENEFYLKFKCADISSSTWIYVLQGCMKHRNNWRSALTMTGVPHDEIKIWKITRTTTHLKSGVQWCDSGELQLCN